MLTGIGRRPATGDLVDLLVDCHERIRSFTTLALRLARTTGIPPGEVASAAAQVRRYFVEALPLHARDEEESLLPRLRGRDPALDAELAAMEREHAEHEPVVAEVVALCSRLADDPSTHAAHAPALEAAASALERHFGAHLEREERAVFPAIRRLLPNDAQAAIVGELRARRA